MSEGYGVRQVTTLASGTSDDFILQMAMAEGEVIITDDKDFSELVFLKALSNCGVMLLRWHGLPRDTRAEIVLNVIQEYGVRLEKNFSVITPNQVRLRN